MDVTVALGGDTRQRRHQITALHGSIDDAEAAGQLVERCVLGAEVAGQRLPVGQGDGLAEPLLEIHAQQGAVAYIEAQVAVELIDPAAHAVAPGAQVHLQIQTPAYLLGHLVGTLQRL